MNILNIPLTKLEKEQQGNTEEGKRREIIKVRKDGKMKEVHPREERKSPMLKSQRRGGVATQPLWGMRALAWVGLGRRGHKSKREVVRLWTSEARGASLQRGGTSTQPHVYWEPWEGSGLGTGQALVDPLQVWGLG